ncbi:MAG: alpha/beta hydrolase [Tissierellia bacterium]|nr:alpha/beta hydrolase [Bacillota bacterium]NLL23565.1 alpha/beta hydrolase [Tissierellia bacterium]
MKVYEFGKDNKNTFLMFQCAVGPWWVFKKSAEAVAKDFRVFLFISDGHDESGTDFVSIERNVKQAVSYLKEKNIFHLDIAYGISMGGSSVMYMLAHQLIPVKKAIIDAGITPYPYPKWLCRIIAIRDYLMVKAAFRSIQLMKIAMPPQRWTPKGEDPQEHYLKLFEFGKNHYSDKTIYNVFWSTNNYPMPKSVPTTETEMEYWYGEEEKTARRRDLAYAQKAFPLIMAKEFKAMAHGELVMMFPERFHREVMRFWKKI